MKNFVSRCVAAMAGNGAILLSIGNYIAKEPRSAVTTQQAPLLGILFLFALLALALAYAALDLEEKKPASAAQRLKWSARLFFISMFGLGLALVTVNLT